MNNKTQQMSSERYMPIKGSLQTGSNILSLAKPE